MKWTKAGLISFRVGNFSYQLSVISGELSVVSFQFTDGLSVPAYAMDGVIRDDLAITRSNRT